MFSIIVLLYYYAAKFNGCFLVWSFLSLECPSLASRQTPTYPSKPLPVFLQEAFFNHAVPLGTSLDPFHLSELCPPFVSGSTYPKREGRTLTSKCSGRLCQPHFLRPDPPPPRLLCSALTIPSDLMPSPTISFLAARELSGTPQPCPHRAGKRGCVQI